MSRCLAPGHVEKGVRRCGQTWEKHECAPGPLTLPAMPRPPRLQVPGGIYHVTSRGNRHEAIFHEGIDRERFLSMFGEVAALCLWRCHAYCLMSNHYHLLLETQEGNISSGMQRLNGRYARWFNRRHGFEGHVFQERFHTVLVESNWHLLELSRYIAMNPVRAGLCSHAADWPWSSYRALVGQTPAPPFLSSETVLANFGSTPDLARRAFCRFLDDALPSQSAA
jgi:putative transposase